MAEMVQDKKARKARRTVIGVVAKANRTPQTLRVEVEYRVRHPQYNKYVRHRTVLHAHDARQEARQGDRVQIMECRPISKTKKWRLVKVLERSIQGEKQIGVDTRADSAGGKA
jgi:small subunit ribosomal protein S17